MNLLVANRIWNRLKTIGIFAGCIAVLIVSVQLVQYRDPPDVPWTSLVGMVSFPLGCIGIASAIAVLLWATLRRR